MSAFDEPIAVLDTPGDRPQYVYGHETFLVRFTRGEYVGLAEEYHVEIAEHPRMANKHDDGFRYLGTVPRELARVVLLGYFGSVTA